MSPRLDAVNLRVSFIKQGQACRGCRNSKEDSTVKISGNQSVIADVSHSLVGLARLGCIRYLKGSMR